MKKLLVGLFVFAFLITGIKANASTLSDALLQIQNLKKEIASLNLKLKGSALDSLYGSQTYESTYKTQVFDSTPRISYYPGKVNQHIDIASGTWQTDSNGSSGSEIDKLTYCKKFYPNTTSVVEYKTETIDSWHDAGNVNTYTSTRMSYECVQSTSVSLPNLSVSLDSANPVSQTITAGSGNVIFARLKIKAGFQDVNNLKEIQIVSDLANSMKLNNLAIYEGNTKIGSTNYGLTYNGSYYQTWVTLSDKLLIPANTSKVLSIVADIPPVGSSSYFNGNVRLGVSGWTFDYPGANVSPFGTAIHGNIFTIVSSIVTGSSITVLSPNGGEVYGKGQPVKISLSGGLYLSRVGLVYPDFNPNSEISDGNDVHWLSVSSDAGKSFVWDGSSFIDIDGNKNYFTAGTGNYKIVAIRDVDSNQCYKSKISNCIFDISDNVFTIKSSIIGDGCLNGQVYSSTTGAKCPAVSSCIDSDGGKNINVKGFTDGRVNGLGSSFYDSSVGLNGGACVGTSCTGVAEGYCENGNVTNLVIQCPSGYSVNGVCTDKTITTPTVTILSPKGGETYKLGDKITIKWETKNIPINIKNISIDMPFSYISSNGAISTNGGICSWSSKGDDYKTMNDGIETVVFTEDCIKHDNGVKSALPTSARIEVLYKDSSNENIWTRAYSDYFIITDTTTNICPANVPSVNCPAYETESVKDANGCIIAFRCKSTNIEGCTSGAIFSSTTGERCYGSNSSDNSTRINRLLKWGTVGDDVKKLQEFLGIGADGVFGRGTASKVKEWQVNNGLIGDGLFGYQSRVKANLNN